MKRYSGILAVLLLSISVIRGEENPDARLISAIEKWGFVEVMVPREAVSDEILLTRNVSIIAATKETYTVSLSHLTYKWFLSQKYPYSFVEREYGKGVETNLKLKGLSTWDSYPTLTEYDSIMKALAINYPSLCRLDTIGTSVMGKSILVLKISDNVNVDEDEPEVFYTSTIHGDELLGFPLMIRLAHYLLTNYPTDSRVAAIIDNSELWINPLSNPDGTYGAGNTISSPTRYNANGVDLNRNFPDPLNPGTVQQKETIDMMSFMRSRRFVLSANFHSGAEVVNYPWDRWLSKIHADNAWFNQISRAYADTVHTYGTPGYFNDLDNGVVRGAVWYVILGGRQDFVTYELQGREVTIELDYTKETPAAQLPLYWEYHYRSLLGYIENAMYGVRGNVTDFDTGAPLKAKIFITGHDKDSSHVYSHDLDGRYHRMLSPGIWSISYSAPGYRDTTITVSLPDRTSAVELPVALKPLATLIPDTTDRKIIVYPVPSSGTVNIILPGFVDEVFELSVYDFRGGMVLSGQLQISNGNPGSVDLNNLSPGRYIIKLFSKSSGRQFTAPLVILNNQFPE